MKKAAFIFPNQLFENSPVFDLNCEIYLIEEFLFFNHYKFHKQKIAFHRASMKTYQDYLKSLGKKVHYIDALSDIYDVRILIPKLIKSGLKDLHIIDPNDNWLEKHINGVSKDIEVVLKFIPDHEKLKYFTKEELKNNENITFESLY